MANRFRLFHQPFRARFLNRPNRFLILCELRGRKVAAFLPNPGRLQELLLPGCTVHLVEEGSRNRKYRYTAVAVERDLQPIMVHTHRTNDVARYLLEHEMIPGLEKAKVIRPEIRVGRSRFDFLLEDGAGKMFLEVKSCTLVGKKVAMFPDAVTERGARHLRELAELAQNGIRAAVVFVVHWPFSEVFMPDYHTDLGFSRTLLDVKGRVKIIPLAVHWGPDLSLLRGAKLMGIPWDYINQEAHDRGSYLLILRLEKGMKLEVGRLDRVSFERGYYVYVGSAMANLTRRIERHRRLRKQHHWHIDELRAVAEFHAALAIRSSDRLECEIAGALSMISNWTIPGFGCTDCSCPTHLFGMRDDPLRSPPFHRFLQYFRMDRYEITRHPDHGDGNRWKENGDGTVH